MRPSLPRLRHLALIIALLPGLLLCQGERLTVCLHAWIGVRDACLPADSGSSLPECCGKAEEGASIASQGACGSCCIELAAQETEKAAPAPSASALVAIALALPPSPVPAAVARAVALAQGTSLRAGIWSRPGRAPIPLRI